MNERTLEFNCYRVYDMKRFTANPKIDKYIVGYHLQKMEDSHTLCKYKTDINKINGRWTVSIFDYFCDAPYERDTICFRCLRIWALKNSLTFPRQWMIDRVSAGEREARKVIMRGDNNE